MKHVSGKRMIKVAEDMGWVYLSHSGSHAKLRNPYDDSTVIIPVHVNHDLRAGVQKQIMKTLGITDEDL